MFVGLSPSPASVIATGYAAQIQRFRVKRPKVEPPIFRDRSLLCGLDDKTARKRQIGPNCVLAITARVFSNKCVLKIFAIFGDPS